MAFHKHSDWVLAALDESAIIALQMKPENWISIIQLVITVLALFAGPWWAVRRSLKQFQSQKWWEKKEELYRAIISDLSVVRTELHAAAAAEFAALGSKSPFQMKEETLALLTLTHNNLRRHANLGDYLISKEAEQALKTYVLVFWDSKETDLGPRYGLREKFEAVNKCLTILKQEVRRELGAL
jgi:hypothetical protein